MSERTERRPGGSPRATVTRLHRQARYGRWFKWHLAAALAVFFASAFAGYALLGSIPIENLQELLEAAPGESPLAGVEFTFPSITFDSRRALLLISLGAVTGGLLSLVVDGLRAYADGHASFWLYPIWWRPPTPSLYVTSDPRVLGVSLAVVTAVFLADRYLTDRAAST
jgi:hypothetical protein